MNLVVTLGTTRVDLAPGTTTSIEVKSFTDSAMSYPMLVTHGRDGFVTLMCRCPARRHLARSCKHERVAEQLLEALGVVVRVGNVMQAVA